MTAALHDPILFLLMEDEMYLDVDPIRAINRYPAYEREKRFGREGTPEFDSAIQKYRAAVIDRLVLLTQRFISGLAASVACFPSRYCLMSLIYLVCYLILNGRLCLDVMGQRCVARASDALSAHPIDAR